MTVWVAQKWTDYEGEELLGVFATRAGAEAEAEKWKQLRLSGEQAHDGETVTEVEVLA